MSTKNRREFMPPWPTDETTIVPPPEHRDVHGKRGWKKPVLVGTAVLAAAASALGIGEALGSGSSTTPDQKPTASAPATPGEATQSPSAETSSTAPEQHTGSDEFVGEVLKQTTSVEAMDTMTVSDYAQLPFADRLAYAIAKVGDAYPVISPTDEFDPSSIPGWFWQQASGDAANNENSDQRAKLAGSYDYYVTDKESGQINEAYQKRIDSVVSMGGEGIGSSSLLIYEDSGNLQHGTDRAGNPIDFYNVTYHVENETSGEVDPAETTQAIRVQIQLLDGDSVVFYARGYDIEGHQSPVDGYPY